MCWCWDGVGVGGLVLVLGSSDKLLVPQSGAHGGSVHRDFNPSIQPDPSDSKLERHMNIATAQCNHTFHLRKFLQDIGQS